MDHQEFLTLHFWQSMGYILTFIQIDSISHLD
jgi:hypothetical protein